MVPAFCRCQRISSRPLPAWGSDVSAELERDIAPAVGTSNGEDIRFQRHECGPTADRGSSNRYPPAVIGDTPHSPKTRAAEWPEG